MMTRKNVISQVLASIIAPSMLKVKFDTVCHPLALFDDLDVNTGNAVTG